MGAKVIIVETVNVDSTSNPSIGLSKISLSGLANDFVKEGFAKVFTAAFLVEIGFNSITYTAKEIIDASSRKLK